MRIMTKTEIDNAKSMLREGYTPREVAEAFDTDVETLKKTILDHQRMLRMTPIKRKLTRKSHLSKRISAKKQKLNTSVDPRLLKNPSFDHSPIAMHNIKFYMDNAEIHPWPNVKKVDEMTIMGKQGLRPEWKLPGRGVDTSHGPTIGEYYDTLNSLK